MRRIMWFIIPVNIFGISMAVLALLGLIKPLIVVIPFVFTPTLIDSIYRALKDPQRRNMALLTLTTSIMAILILLFIALKSMF